MTSLAEKFFRGNGLNLGESVVKELVDIDNDPTAKINTGGITTIGHVDDKGGMSAAQQLEKSLIAADFVPRKGLDGSKTFKSKSGYVKISGNNAEVNVNGKKYNVDLNKFKPADIMKLITVSTAPTI